MSEKILIAVADSSDRAQIMAALKSSGYGVYDIGEIVSAADAFAKVNPNVIIADTEFTEWFIAQFRQASPAELPIICYLKDHNARLAYDFLKKGAFDCITDPIRPIEIVDIVNKALSKDVISFDKTSKQTIYDYLAALPTAKKISLGAGTAAFLALFWFLVYLAAKPPVKKEIEIRNRYITGVVAGEKTFLVSDWYTQSIYRYGRKNGELLDVYYFSDFGPLGLATDGNAVYSIGTDAKIRRHVLNEAAQKLEITDEFTVDDVASPGGIFIEKEFLWVGDAQLKKIVLFEMIQSMGATGGALKKIAQYATGSISPVAISKKGEKIYIADGVTGSVFSGRVAEDKFIAQKENASSPFGGKIAALYTDGPKWLAVFVDGKTLLRRVKLK